MKAKHVKFDGFDGKTYNGLLTGTRNRITTIAYTVYSREGRQTVIARLTKQEAAERVHVLS